MIKIKLVFVSFLSCLGCQIGLAQQTIVLKIQLPGYPFILPGLSTMAFSFTLDDGYRSAFTCAYPLLNGELVSPSIPDEYHNDSGGDGESSTGLFYTDSCGNKITFRLAVALNAGIVYDHPDNL